MPIINDLNERLRTSERFMTSKDPDRQDNIQQLNWENLKNQLRVFPFHLGNTHYKQMKQPTFG